MKLGQPLLLCFLLATPSAWLSCAAEQSGPGTEEDCTSGKCDDPGAAANRECQEECGGDRECFQRCRDEAALGHCEARRSDAIESSQRAFTRDAIRWSCSDVEGVNTNFKDSRGQEYCEYYAVVQPPPQTEGGDPMPSVALGRNESSGGQTPLSLELTDDQIFALEDEPDSVVGQCVFTSWHQDIQERYPICGDSDVSCPKLGVPADARLPSWHSNGEYNEFPLISEYMRMKVSINSNNAAADLFEKCLTSPPAGDPANSEDPLHDDYMRGCWKSYELFRTEWRRSDPSVCAAGVRLAECGCGVDTNADGVPDITDAVEISRAVVPFQPDQDGTLRLRGFHLGTWSDHDGLPTGCRYVDTGESEETTRTLVACDLTAADVLSSQLDPKQRCREKYGDNVVVHVPVPADAIACVPPEDGQYADTCSEMPWVLGSAPAAE